ncbi:MAG: hypothetical protein ACKVP3_00550 [Hyphomicrobiaceae bacterium]
MDDRQRVALARSILMDSEEELASMRRIAEDTREVFRKLDKDLPTAPRL